MDSLLRISKSIIAWQQQSRYSYEKSPHGWSGYRSRYDPHEERDYGSFDTATARCRSKSITST
jgi:hypothetical protein